MKILGIAVLMMASVGWGQKPCVGGAPPKNDSDCVPAEKLIQVPAPQVAPLKCGKYQHVDPAHCANTCDLKTGTCIASCLWVPASCADDMHMVTEREWQELMERLRKLEIPFTVNVTGGGGPTEKARH